MKLHSNLADAGRRSASSRNLPRRRQLAHGGSNNNNETDIERKKERKRERERGTDRNDSTNALPIRRQMVD